MSTRAATRRGAVAGGGTIDDSDENGDAATAEDDGDARAPAPTEEEAEEDEDPAAAEDLSRARSNRTWKTCGSKT